jgi:hypothetical protein
MGFVSGVAGVVILFQETRELIPVEPAPACAQAAEKFEFANGENRHGIYPTRPAVGTTSALSGNTVLASTLSSTLK